MERSLLRHLQSMKRIEDDPANRFQTETLDLRNFTPQYPNVIVVDQRAPDDGTGPVRRVKHGKPQVLPHIHKMPHKRLFVCRSLSKAIAHVVVVESGFIHSGGAIGEGWTLLLKEGLYVDPDLSLSLVEYELNPDFQVEIIGLNDVRILTLSDEKRCAFAGVKMTLRNLRFYDFRPEKQITDFLPPGFPELGSLNPIPLFGLSDKARVKFQTVKVACRFTGPISATNEAVGFLEDCSLIDGRMGLRATNSSKLFLSHSLVARIALGGTAYQESGIVATKTAFIDCTKLLFYVQVKSKCVFRQCFFENTGFSGLAIATQPDGLHAHLRNSNETFSGFAISGGSSVLVEDSTFQSFMEIGYLHDFKSEMTLRKCKIRDTYFILGVEDNASATVEDCQLDCGYLMQNIRNTHGKIKLKGNTLGDITDACVLTDAPSKKLKHDIEGLRYDYRGSGYSPRFTDQQRSERTKNLRQAASESRDEFFRSLCLLHDPFLVKGCEYCLDQDFLFLGDEDKQKRKYLYCRDCREICYCSKECQVADWPNHRLLCTRRTVNEPRDPTSGGKSRVRTPSSRAE